MIPERGANHDIAVFPAGSPWPGRVVSASRPAMLSDDGGQTYYPSGLWEPDYIGELVALAERPGVPGSVRIVLVGFVNAGGGRIWRSDDGGQTWDESLMEPGLDSPRHLLSLGGPSLLMVHSKGTVRRSDDGGQTWETLGRAPVVDVPDDLAKSAVLGPDGRLYVGVVRSGPDREWVYRTAERFVPVAAEPGPEGPAGVGLEVVPNPSRGGAEVVLTLAQPSEVEVSLYDTLGRRVARLHEGLLAAGRHALAVEGADLPAGVYVVRAAVGESVVSRRVTLLP